MHLDRAKRPFPEWRRVAEGYPSAGSSLGSLGRRYNGNVLWVGTGEHLSDALAQLDTGIQHGVGQVDEEVHRTQQRRVEHDQPDFQQEIAL